MLQLFLLVIPTVLITYFGVSGIRLWAEQRHLLAYPNARSSHQQPTPRGGGLAIVLVCILVLTVYLSTVHLSTIYLSTVGMLQSVGFIYLIGAILVAGISWLDDMYTMPMLLRLAVHGVSALLVVGLIGSWHSLSLPFTAATIALGWWGPILTFLWIVGITNIYNFMDGIDGLAAGQALVAGLAWGILGWWIDQPVVALIGFCIAAASGGFLGHNWAPARIFMGDVGSAFLGYTFAVLTVIAMQVRPDFLNIGILLLWPFLFDSCFTMLCRFQKRENLFEAHRSHLYQRLVVAGYDHSVVAAIYLGLALIGVFLAFACFFVWPAYHLGMTIVPTILAIGLWRFVIWTERHNHKLLLLSQAN